MDGRETWRPSSRPADATPRNLIKLLVTIYQLGCRNHWEIALAYSRIARSWLVSDSPAADMADALHELACWPGCTAAQLRCAAGMLHAFAANQVAEDTASRSPDSRKAAHEAAEVIQAARRLVAIDPGSARYRYLLAATFQDHDLEAQMSELRSALQAAERARCE